MTTSISIYLDDPLAFRLAVYANEKGEKSFSDAIRRLLDNTNVENQPPIGQQHLLNHNAEHLPHRRPEVVYLSDISDIANNMDNPVSEEIFKQDILRTKLATVNLFYHDGRSEIKTWNVVNLSSNSSIKGNLNTGYLRGWRQKGIKKIVLTVIPF